MTLLHSSAIQGSLQPRHFLYPHTEFMQAVKFELALMRFKRTGALSDPDRETMRKLLEFLENARKEGNAIVLMYAGIWQVASDKSIDAFHVVLAIFPWLGVREKDAGPFLGRLHATVQTLLNGGISTDQELNSLQSFLKAYRSYWDQ